MAWIKDEWQLQWPLIRFELYKWGAITCFGLVVALFAKFVHGVLAVRDSYFYGGLFLLACMGMAVFVRKFQRSDIRSSVSQQQSIEPVTPTLVNSPNITVQTITDAYNALDLQMTRETEAGLRNTLQTVAGQDREVVLIRALVATLVLYQMEEIWNTIYGSQISALHVLNTQTMKRVDLQPFYNFATVAWPAGYQLYSFDQWIGYMRDQLLLFENGDSVGITVRGRAFLKMLVDTGRSAANKIM